jgi:[acyl-carrier-protein] S-malonyltransferase
MKPAAETMKAALANIEIRPPAAPLVANVLAVAIQDPEQIRASLVEQITGAVRWREGVLFMASRGVDRFVELGSGRVLTGLVKRIVEGAIAVNVGAPADVEAYAAPVAAP